MLKKTFLTTVATLLALSCSSFAFAAKNNNYVGLALTQNTVAYRAKGIDSYLSNGDFTHNFSLNYGYNLGGLINDDTILAVDVFYDNINSSVAKATEVNNRFGAQLDAGYKVAGNLSAFVSGGFARVSAKTNVVSAKTDNVVSPIYGFGLRNQVNDRLSVDFRYNVQSFDTKFNPLASAQSINKVGVRIETAKIGANFHF